MYLDTDQYTSPSPSPSPRAQGLSRRALKPKKNMGGWGEGNNFDIKKITSNLSVVYI